MPDLSNPFPGLRPFTQDEDYLFFGREEQTIKLLQRLGGNRFVAVVGTSGSGKSSLVRCGLLSQLLGGKMLGAGAAWEIAVTHPGGNPLVLLTDALLEADLYDRAKEHARENLLATLSRSHFGLVEAVKQADLGEGTNFLLVVDQFEEIFRFHEAGQTQQEAANEFVSLLLEAVAQKEVPIYVVLTMRSDFIGECGQFEGLAEMVNRGEFLIPRLNREQYKRVIEGPIKVAGGQIAPRLLQRLLNDLGQQADQLPCLQHALMRTWDVWAGKGDTEALDLDDYQRVGKMSQALSLHADEVYESLSSDRQRELCQGIFQALTVEESNSRGIRRPQRLGRLCQILEVPAHELLPIIDAYRQSGVTFLMPSPEVELSEQTIIDISHESLMRVWTRLRQWVEEETQAAGIYRRLSESAALHERGKAGLYRDPELSIALAWREARRPNAAWAERYRLGFATAIEFLEASQQASVAEEQAREAARRRELEQAQQLAEAQQLRLEQQLRAARKLRKLIAGVAVVAVIAVIAGVAALVARNEAGKLAQIADAEAEKARKNAQQAEQSQQETEKALTQVASSLTKAEKAEQVARGAEEEGRKLLYTTDMRLAPFVWRDDRTTAEQLRVLLAKHIPDRQAAAPKPDFRGFEWHYYQHLLESSAAVFSGHAGSVAGAAFTSNGQLVTLDQHGQVRRWNLGSQDEDKASRRDLPGGPGAQVRALSPNGRLAALAEGNKVHVFDTSMGKEQLQINSAQGRARRLLFTPDSGRLVIVDDKIRWCNAVSGQVIASVNQGFMRGSSLALSADGLTLAVVGHGTFGNQFSIFRLDRATQKVTPQAKDAGFGGTLSAAALSPEGRLIAVGAKLSGSVFVFDTGTGRPLTQHGSAHASPVSALTFSGDGFKLVTGDVAGTIKIWEDARKLTSKSAAAMTLKGHEGEITHVGFSSAGKQLVSTSADKTARVWDLEHTGAAIRVLERSGNDCYMARFSADGQLIAAADGVPAPTDTSVKAPSSVRLWDAATGKLVRELPAGDKGRVHSVAFSPTDHRLLAVGYGGKADVSFVSLWDIDAGTELARLPGATDLPDFRLDEHTGVVGALAFSPDGKYLVAGFGSPRLISPASSPSPLKVWEVATRRLIRRLSGHTGYCVSLDFSRDGARLASGSRDGTAIIWSTESWKALHTLQNPEKDSQQLGQQRGMVEDVAFSPDGKTLALASREGTVQLWDVAGGKLLKTLKGHSSAVGAVAFSPDGRTLATGGGDQTVRLWNVETRRELMQLDSGNVELGGVETLAFSPDGKHLLAGGRRTAVWSTTPVVWNDPDRAAEKLRRLLQSNAGFQSRIRMLSENLRLHAALAKLDSKDVRVAAALAAAQANWHASRQAWPEAALAFDRLLAADPTAPQAWLRTPGLLRLATALLHQDRPRDAAALLTGGAKRRALDGLPAAVERAALGMMSSAADGLARVTELLSGSPAARSGLLPGDVIMKVDDTELTRESLGKLAQLLAGEAGTKVRLTVRHSGSERPEVIELTRERFVNDAATGELLHPLRAAINGRLAREPRHPGLLELRAELTGQWSDTKAQVADYTAAIEVLSRQKPEATAVDLKRLYGRRGNLYVSLEKWQEAVADFTHAVTRETTDEELLTNQARALAALVLRSQKQFAAMIIADPWAGFAAAYRLGRDQEAIDQLVERRPQLAGQIGDLFAADKDWPRAVEIYSRGITAKTSDAVLLTKRARAYESLASWDAAAADWARAATGNPEGARLLADFAQRLAAGDQVPLANGQFAKAQALYERSLSADPENDVVATELAQLLLNKYENGKSTRWTVLNPTEMKSKGGATLTKLDDDSILAGGVNPNKDTYTFVAQTDLPKITAFRLEALAHPSLPKGGPGRISWGNFALSEILLKAQPRSGAGDAVTVKLINPRADFEQANYPVAASLDGNSGTAWSIDPQVGKNHAAVFEIESARQNGFKGGTKLTFTLDFQFGNKHAIGRFRLSVSGDPAAREREEKRFSFLMLTDPWLRLGAAYAVNGRNEQASQYFSRALQRAQGYEARKPILELAARFDDVLSALVQRQPDDAQLQLALARKLAARGKQRLADKQPAEALAQLQKSREVFTRLRAEPQWTVLTPVEMKTETGAKMELQKDGSVFVHQPPKNDTYALVFQTELKGIKGLRLEALADSRIPGGGPGWDGGGNFVLSELSLQAALAKSPDQPRPIALGNASADFSQVVHEGGDVRGAVDGNGLTGWAVWPEVNKDHVAVFETAEEVGDGQATRLTVRLNHQYFSGKALLGRFRLSFTNDAATLQATRIRWDLKDSEVVDLNVALAKAHAQQGHISEALASFTEALDLAADRADKARIIAAATALAAAGQSQHVSVAPLDDAAKAKFRRQVLDWLKAELTAWTKLLESASPQDRLSQDRRTIVLALSRWQQDSNLAGIRDKAALAKLPAEEQKAFTQLWADAAELLTKADGGFRALPAAEQVEEVRKELKKRNPGFDGSLTHSMEGGVVTGLSITGKDVTDLAPVRALAGLKSLVCTKGPLSDLSPLKSMPLTGLNLQSTQVRNLEPLKGMPLTSLDLWNCGQVRDLEPLAGMPLTALSLYTSQVRDLTPLKGMPLYSLYLAGCTQLRDVTSLKGMRLTSLNLDNTQVSDLNPLQGMPLTKLELWNCKVQDLNPLKGMRLTHLELRGCSQVRDLTPLTGMPLKYLAIYGAGVTDLRPLQGMPLEFVLLTPENITEGLDTLRNMKSLKTIGTSYDQHGPAAEFWETQRKKRFPALLRGDDKPADNAERLSFARIAYDQKKFAFATRLWAEALASDPKLGDDRQIQPRYNAARAAALAAASQGKDEPPLDDAAKAKLRRQALDWLRAELTVWTKQLASAPPQARPAIVQTLSHWQKDPDLAGIRVAAALAKLPAEEQKAFTQLWADVAALLKKAKEKSK